MPKKHILLYIVLWMLFQPVEPSFAAWGGIKYTICLVKGTLTITQLAGGKTCYLKRSLKVTECTQVSQDVIVETGPHSFATIEYPGWKAPVKIGPYTKVKLKGYRSIYVLDGSLWRKVEYSKGTFIIRTISSYAINRGTEFLVDVADDGTTIFRLIEGKLEVSDLAKQKTVMLTAGMEVKVPVGSPPSMPVMSHITDNEKWWTDWPTLVPIAEMPPDVSDIVRLGPVADSYAFAYAYRNWNKANWGKYGSLGAGWHPTGGEKRTYLKFDLSGINPKNVGKATLKLFHYHTGGNNSLSLGVHAVTSPWQEGGGTYHSAQKEKTAAAGEISWVNQPSFNPDPIAQFNPGPGTNKFVEVDITPLVMAWLTGKPNYGLMIKPVGIMSGRAPEASYGFYSREHQDKSKRPVLILSGSSSSDTPTGSKRPLGDITRITDYPQAAENIRGAPCGIDRTFVFSLFQCILERDPEKKELAEQVQNLQSGMSRKEMVIRFFKSKEYLNKMKSGRESYKDAFQAVLGRNPSSEEIRAFPRTWPFMMAMKLFGCNLFLLRMLPTCKALKYYQIK